MELYASEEVVWVMSPVIGAAVARGPRPLSSPLRLVQQTLFSRFSSFRSFSASGPFSCYDGATVAHRKDVMPSVAGRRRRRNAGFDETADDRIVFVAIAVAAISLILPSHPVATARPAPLAFVTRTVVMSAQRQNWTEIVPSRNRQYDRGPC